LKSSDFSREWNVAEERARGGGGEIKRRVRRMSKLTEIFWESVPKSWCNID